MNKPEHLIADNKDRVLRWMASKESSHCIFRALKNKNKNKYTNTNTNTNTIANTNTNTNTDTNKMTTFLNSLLA